MCKAAHVEYLEGGDEDNSYDKSNEGSIENESWDFSMMSVHIYSIGFSIGTVLVIIITEEIF